MIFRMLVSIAGLLALLSVLACEVEPEITLDDVDVHLDTTGNPFGIQSKLTPEQANGEADVLVSFGAVTHLARETRGGIDRTPGRVIGHAVKMVEVVYSRQDDRGEYVIAFVRYSDGTDPDDLHDGEPNIASCRFGQSPFPGSWPVFEECSKVN